LFSMVFCSVCGAAAPNIITLPLCCAAAPRGCTSSHTPYSTGSIAPT
jgi:hypothetical protein